MKKLTVTDLVNEIAQLGTEHVYKYVSGKSQLQIKEVHPNGPIRFVNIAPNGKVSKPRNISTGQLAQMALVCANKPNFPLHIDRVFSAGGNTRSALEALLAHTPNFFTCRPERVNAYSGKTLRNLKHIMWCPDEQHPRGEIWEKNYDQVITEVELGVDFGNIDLTKVELGREFKNIEAKRVHTQMQIALIEIGNALNFRTWIAKNDQAIEVNGKRLSELDGVIRSLDDFPILYNKEIKEAATLIDCIWLTADGKRIPAVIEIEHSTGVKSGLTRMLILRQTFPSIITTFTVVAPNQLRNKVVAEANQEIYQQLEARFMPYSTIRELYGLIQRYSLSNAVDYRFIDPFMERVVER
jgi:type II restriction enzyme